MLETTTGLSALLTRLTGRFDSLKLGFALLLVVLLGSATISALSSRRIFEDQDLLVHTYDVRSSVREVDYQLTLAEGLQRKYFLLGLAGDREEYATAAESARREAGRLEGLVIDNPTQTEAVGRLREAIEARIKRMEFVLAEFDKKGPEIIPAISRFGPGVALMNRFREVGGEIRDRENLLLTCRLQDSRASVVRTVSSFVISTLLGVMLLTGFYFLMRRFLETQERAKVAALESRAVLEREVHARELAQQAERRVATELRRSNRELQDFAFVASHDLQEPLRKILQFGDRVRRRDGERLSPEGHDSLDRMQNAANRMQRLIEDLLTFSRVTSKALPFRTVDLGKVMTDVREDLSTRIEEMHGRVEVDPLPTIQADPTQMHQLLQNLVGNALKFAKPGESPHVEVRCAREGPEVRITVRDHGIGFDQRHAEKIFTIFQRLHARDQYEGSGIGLAICRKIVERHQGEISAASVPGEGTVFTILLPMEQREGEVKANEGG